MPTIDLKTEGSEVEEIASRADRGSHNMINLHPTGNVAAIKKEVREVDVNIARSLLNVASIL